ncbi:hypothetical protein [Roseateles sp. LKC17W]|uniref:Uncharacterized protein n=1 Tax=Pelomonas margarita TaxID=3299031 RepID=A0ABW7FJR3_9BURK
MSIQEALKHASSKPAGKRPYFMTPEVERVLAITMALVQELAVSRQRQDTLERLLLAQGVIAPGAVDGFRPDATAAAERALWTQEYLARVLRILQQENEAAALGDELASEDVAVEVARPA